MPVQTFNHANYRRQMPYVGSYIKAFPPKDYYEYLMSPNKLHSLITNHHKRYNKIFSKYNGNLDKLAESLEHYVIYKLDTDYNFHKDDQYFNFIDYIMDRFYNEPASCASDYFLNVCDLEQDLKPYISATDYQKILKTRSKYFSYYEDIFDRMDRGENINQLELDNICDYFANIGEINTNNFHHIMMYLMSDKLNYPNNSGYSPSYYRLKFNLPEINFMLRYLPRYYQLDPKAHNFDTEHIRFVNSDYDEENKVMTANGVNYDAYTCFLNRNFYQTIKSGMKSDPKNIYDCSTFDLPNFLVTVFHELTHSVQSYKCDNNIADEQSLSMNISNVEDQYLGDYKDNYSGNLMEIDAEMGGYYQAYDFIEKYYTGEKKNEITKTLGEKYNGTQARKYFSTKTDKPGVSYTSIGYDWKKIVELVRQNPSEVLGQNPMLCRFFDAYGNIDYHKIMTRKKEDQTPYDYYFIECFLFDNKDLHYLQRIISPVKVVNDEENLIQNIYEALKQNLGRIQFMTYYRDKGFTIKGLNTDTSIEQFDDLNSLYLSNVLKEYNTATRMLNYLRSVTKYRYLVSDIDFITEKINNLVKDVVSEANVDINHKLDLLTMHASATLPPTSQDLLNGELYKVEQSKSFCNEPVNFRFYPVEEQIRFYKTQLVEAKRTNNTMAIIVCQSKINQCQNIYQQVSNR